ncbi:MAG: hypothetical protein QCI82_07770 [Candidatus Thermoplasmatota archaeon]|nr:hypothetical protein [Candidatus Thermoplasmatota archaeon]
MENTGNSLDIIGIENFYLDTWIFPYSYTDASMTEVTDLGGNEEVVDCSVSNVIISKITEDEEGGPVQDVDDIAPGSFQLGFNHTGSGQVEFRLYETNRYNPPIQLISPDPLSTYNWHRITVTGTYSFFLGQSRYDLSLFIDGIPVDSTNTTLFNRQENSDMVTIGADPRSYALIKDGDNNYGMQERYAQFYGIIDHIMFSYRSPYQQNFICGEHLHVGEIVGKYDFDEGAGHLAHDQSNYDRTLTLNNVEYAPEWGWDERWGHCLDFNYVYDPLRQIGYQDSFQIEDSPEFSSEYGGVGIGFKFKPDNYCPYLTFIIGKTTSVNQGSSICGFTWAFWYSPSNSQIYFEINYYSQGMNSTNYAVYGSPNDDSEWIDVYGYTDFGNTVQLYLNGEYVDGTSMLGGFGPEISGIDTKIHIGSAQWLNTSGIQRWEPYRYFLMPFDDIEGYRGLFDDLVFSRNCRINQVSERGFFDLDTAVYDPQNDESYVVDKSSNDHKLIKDGMATSALNGAFENCLAFNGSTSDVWRIEEYDIIDLSDSFTIELWLNLTLEGSPRTLISQASDVENTRRSFVLGTNISGHPYFSVYDTTSSQTLTVISPVDLLPDNVYLGNWHHVMARFIDRGGENGVDEISLHVDGYLDPDCVLRQSNIAIEASTRPILLGGSKGKDEGDPSNVFNGTLDELRFCQGVRTLYEDFDNDGMSDINEIMRSTMSDQYHPYRHNSRCAFIASAVSYLGNQQTFPPSDWGLTQESFGDDTYYYRSGMDMYKCLRELNYQDEDIIYLTTYLGIGTIDFTWTHNDDDSYLKLTDFAGLQLPIINEFPFPIDGFLTYNNIRAILQKYAVGGQIDIEVGMSTEYLNDEETFLTLFEEITMTKLDSLDNLFLYYIDHGGNGNGMQYPDQPIIQDKIGEPNYQHDTLINNGDDEYIMVFDIVKEYNKTYYVNGQLARDPLGNLLTRNVHALMKVRYYDDQIRYDLDNINVKYISCIVHACHSGGFIEDLMHEPNRILISSCMETEVSYSSGPLFTDWLNERHADYSGVMPPVPQPHKYIENADRNIANGGPTYYQALKLDDYCPSFVGNNNNTIISIQEMFFNSKYSVAIDQLHYINLPYYHPTIIIGGIIPEQIYL